MRSGVLGVGVSAVALLFCSTSAWAIVGGQTDDFEDGTLQSWGNGGSAPAVLNISTGGPTGVNDNFMQVTSTGTSPGPFLTVFNRSQWLGDYIGAGVTAIEMDLKNLGATDLNIRLGFKSSTGIGSFGYLSDGFSLLANSGWEHAVFLIDSNDLTAIGSPSVFATFFSDGLFQEMRIINETGASNLNGDAVAAQLGVDNIHAVVAVPEPRGIAIVGLALGCLLMGKGKKQQADV